jgi:phosphoribosylaminoimidazole-succinocarboxamide synthase
MPAASGRIRDALLSHGGDQHLDLAALRSRFAGFLRPPAARRYAKESAAPRATFDAVDEGGQGGHDESVSRAEILARGTLRADEFDEAAALCARLFAFGQAEAAKRGLILVDTKYEIGRRPDGSLCFIDEIHTPDSSRYWYADDYESRLAKGEEPRGLDKEYVRRVLAEQGYRGEGPPPPLSTEVRCEAARRYIALYELVTGRSFVPDVEEPMARIRRHLGV